MFEIMFGISALILKFFRWLIIIFHKVSVGKCCDELFYQKYLDDSILPGIKKKSLELIPSNQDNYSGYY